TYDCRVIDMSMGGAAIAIDVRPLVGSDITVGKMRAKIIRHLDDGVAVEFLDMQNITSLTDHFGLAEPMTKIPEPHVHTPGENDNSGQSMSPKTAFM
ncbi:MAG: PilZ domain-containing protein, partial [Fimbriimonadaceae bacterium]|nr:PilZ domain-containing protein [Alphaproteobacteria bacterium]